MNMLAQKYVCQNCKESFAVEPEDFAFYEKIHIPPPTFCPTCRLQRRQAWRNMRSLYKRHCDLCKEEKIGIFAPDKPYRAYCTKCWWGDEWDAFDFGRAYDFSRNFFEQFNELLHDVPLLARSVYEDTMVNADYTNMAHTLKDCYLVFMSAECEHSAYCQVVNKGNDSLDVSWSADIQLCYEGVNLHNCYKVLYSNDCQTCTDSFFLNDCVNCSYCFGCTNLRSKEYHIFNEPYSPGEYQRKLVELGFDRRKRASITEFSQRAREFSTRFPRKYYHGSNNQDISGDYIYNAKNTHGSFFVNTIEDSKYCLYIMFGGPVKESYDWTQYGDNGELVYEMAQSGGGVYNNHFGWMIWRGCRDVEYSVMMNNCSMCFGCVGLKNKQFCLFNKQYTEEEYILLRAKIVAQMEALPYVDSRGRTYRFGEFFPIALSPYAYNETVAQEEFPFEKKSAEEQGFSWRDEARDSSYVIAKKSTDLPDECVDPDALLKEIIECTRCRKGYRFVKMELAFYRANTIPLPRHCSNCRYQERLEKRGRPILRERQCQCGGEKSKNSIYTNSAKHTHGVMPCSTTLETAYAPDRPDIVYCESCYQSEIV
jgi:hypothetical protein